MRLSSYSKDYGDGSSKPSWPKASKSESSEWHRSFSASDILGMQRTPIRRPFDHPHPSRDGYGGNGKLQSSTLEALDNDDAFGYDFDESPAPLNDSAGRSRAGSDASPGTLRKRAVRDRA